MNTHALPLEYQKADQKRQAKDARNIAKFGHGSTTASMAIAQHVVNQLADGLALRITETMANVQSHSTAYALCLTLQKLPKSLLALCAIQSVLESIGREEAYRDTCIRVGKALNAELWAQRLTIENPKLAENIDRAVRRRHSSVKQRRQAARSAATRAGFSFSTWSRKDTVLAGNWLLDETVRALPTMLECVRRSDGEHMVTVADDAVALAQAAQRAAMLNHPVMQPVTEIQPWTDWKMPTRELRGLANDGFNITFLRTQYRETAAAAKAAIKSGAMKPALDAVSALQGTAWSINHRVLDVIKACIEQQIAVPGLPPKQDLGELRVDKRTGKEKRSKPLPRPWDELTEPERNLWKMQNAQMKEINRGYIGQRILLSEDMETAERMAKEPRFYTPMNCDWRGRVYSLCHFGFQREDRVRALFTFADGEPIGEEGIRWLKIHTANCGDFEVLLPDDTKAKISKRPMEERVRWTDDNSALLQKICDDPLSELFWIKADKPFLFLAACIELSTALSVGASFVSHLPVSFDGSCSGLQHLCAMTRAAEGSLVNLTPQALPQDVYKTVADIVHETVAAEAKENPLAQAWLDHGIDRKVVKRNVMTYAYSSKAFGMAGQQQEDLIEPLGIKVLEGTFVEHPFTVWAEAKHRNSPSPAASYIAKHVYAGIETVVHLPAQAMTMLQKLAKALAHEGKPVRWTTPTGIPWCNRYHDRIVSSVNLFMHDKGVRVRHQQILLSTGMKKEIDKTRASNGIAPNFVHALDASHLMLVANACVAEGIHNIATVHDSFGCLASRATRFNEIIREQFVQMYEQHDVLNEVLAQAKCDLTQDNWHRLPDAPTQGPLNIKEVLNARYCFA
jgi:DNA-directed RNA polymerase